MTVIRYEEGYPLGKCELCGMKDEKATERAFDQNPYEPLAVKALKEGLN